VRDLTGGSVDHAFEVVGRKSTSEQAFAMLRRRGTATIIGMLPAGTILEIPGPALFLERRLQGCFMGSHRFRVDMPFYIDLYLQGRLKLDELIATRIGLDEVNEGYAALANGGQLARSVITFE
jgi:S-(hydroxymethyl)glutathione dehydrogenase/alcohol dehydrogenase